MSCSMDRGGLIVCDCDHANLKPACGVVGMGPWASPLTFLMLSVLSVDVPICMCLMLMSRPKIGGVMYASCAQAQLVQ